RWPRALQNCSSHVDRSRKARRPKRGRQPPKTRWKAAEPSPRCACCRLLEPLSERIVDDTRPCPDRIESLSCVSFQSLFKRQSDILLGEGGLRVCGRVQKSELVLARALIEWRLGGNPVQEHRHPPGGACAPPAPPQRHIGIAIEVMRAAGPVRLHQGA